MNNESSPVDGWHVTVQFSPSQSLSAEALFSSTWFPSSLPSFTPSTHARPIQKCFILKNICRRKLSNQSDLITDPFFSLSSILTWGLVIYDAHLWTGAFSTYQPILSPALASSVSQVHRGATQPPMPLGHAGKNLSVFRIALVTFCILHFHWLNLSVQRNFQHCISYYLPVLLSSSRRKLWKVLVLVITLGLLRQQLFLMEDDQARWAAVGIGCWTDRSDGHKPARLDQSTWALLLDGF